MKQALQQMPKTVYKDLRKRLEEKGLWKEGETKIVRRWPNRASEPGFSLHVFGECVISADLDKDNLIYTMVVNNAGIKKKLDADTQVQDLLRSRSICGL